MLSHTRTTIMTTNDDKVIKVRQNKTQNNDNNNLAITMIKIDNVLSIH